MTSAVPAKVYKSDLRSLLLIFTAWKALIGSLALLSPGIGYDTSSDLLSYPRHDIDGFQVVPSKISNNVLKFVRWDAIYFVSVSFRGHVFEQEWAFGKGLSTTLMLITKVCGIKDDLLNYATVGILLSHVTQLISVVLLYYITQMTVPSTVSNRQSVPYIAALIHVISPAGIFLSAPYTESLFACLNMLGFLLYAKSATRWSGGITFSNMMYKVGSGLVFGLAATVRGNGVLSGLPFLLDAAELALSLFSPRTSSSSRPILMQQLVLTVIAGCCVGMGIAFPQYLAFREYCVQGPGDRPWCKTLLPSIFTFVQSEYWNVGFLRYWTLSNLPLFLLAAPALYILIISGIEGIQTGLRNDAPAVHKLVLRIALPQLVLAILALTNYHVQIITRLSSAYPFWYIWLASKVDDWRFAALTIRVFVCYALIQAGLFATFLPPA